MALLQDLRPRRSLLRLRRPALQGAGARHAEVEIPGRRSNRNHLGSVHAIAVMNLAEMTSGLAMMAGLPPTVRGIVTTLSMTYHKKARGTIRVIARVEVPVVTEDRDFDVKAECFDPEGASGQVSCGDSRCATGGADRAGVRSRARLACSRCRHG